jgi:pimeloyl-ACP methyl ester carboxylesterase
MADYADCLAGFINGLGLENPHVAGLSFGGALALALYRRHPGIPRTLILASAYAGWAGSLPAQVAQQRLRQALVLVDLSPDEFVGALLPTICPRAHHGRPSTRSARACGRPIPPGSGRWRARPPRAFDVLAQIEVPTLLVYGDRDVRAPLAVAEHLREGISGSKLVVLRGAGHVCNVEASEAFNSAVRTFIGGSRC